VRGLVECAADDDLKAVATRLAAAG
jgi:hypothetical protein